MDPWRVAAYSFAVAALFSLILVSSLFLAQKRIGLIEFLLTVTISGLLLYVTRRWVWNWAKVKLTYKVSDSTLFISKSHDGHKPLPLYPKEYDLKNLCAAQEFGDTKKIISQEGVRFESAKLVLIFESEGRAGERQVILRRPAVIGPRGQEAALENQLESWKLICASIHLALAKALEQRWITVSPYNRYWFVVLQAEVEFLQGRCTAPQMCLATLRTIFNPLREVVGIVTSAIVWVVSAFVVLVAVVWVVGAVGAPSLLTGKILLLPLLLVFFSAVAYGILFLFRPLSAQLQADIPFRVNQAKRLTGAGLSHDDLELLLKFLKDEAENVKHRLTILTVATGATALFSLMPKFFTNVSSSVPNILLVVSVVAFAMVQLYYYAQLRIVHLAQTNCLVAESELQRENS